MSSRARVFIVNDDPVEAGRLTEKMSSQGYSGVQVGNDDAFDLIRVSRPDVVIVSGNAHNSGNSRLNLTRALKSHQETSRVPVILIAETAESSAQLEGLRAGADACLPYPYHDLQLFGRIDSMVRLATMQEELQRRRQTAQIYGVEGPDMISPPSAVNDSNLLLVGPADADYEHIEQALCDYGTLVHAHTASTATTYLERRNFDTIMVNVPVHQEEELYRFCQDVRRNSRLYNIPIVCMISGRSAADLTRAFTAGAADVFHHPINMADLRMRIDMLVRQQRYRDTLREAYRQARNVATTDSLTGLYNYGFLMQHLKALVEDAHARSKSLTVGAFSIDNLAEINAVHGYAIADKIMRQVGLVISTLVRGEDLPARLGGGRFALVMPETRLAPGELVAHRIGSVINYTEMMASDAGEAGTMIRPHVTTSVAALEPGMSGEQLLAKASGRG